VVHAVADDEREMAGTTRWSMGGGTATAEAGLGEKWMAGGKNVNGF